MGVSVSGYRKSDYRLHCILLLILLLAVTANGTTYYVSNSGNNDSSGTSEAGAWQTIAHMVSAITGGDTVYFMGGTYAENESTVNISDVYYSCTFPLRAGFNGSAGSPTVFKNAPGYGKPTFKGYGTDGYNDKCDTVMAVSSTYDDSTNYIVFDSLIVKFARRGFSLWCGTNITIQYVTACSTGAGISGESNNGGIYVGTAGSRVDSLTVYACSLYTNWEEPEDSASSHNYAAFMSYDLHHSKILNNVCFNEPRGNGIWFKGDSNDSNEVAYNICIGSGLESSVGIQILGTDYHTIHHNIVYDWEQGMLNYNYAQYYPNEARNNIYYNNTVYNCNYQGMGYFMGGETQREQAEACQWFNNIVVNGGTPLRELGKSVKITITNDDKYLDYNCYWNSGTSTIANWDATDYTLANLVANINIDSHSVNVNPVFADPDNGDFHLTAGSPSSVKTGGIGGDYPTYMGALDPDAVVLNQTLTAVDTTKTTIDVENNYSLSGIVVDTTIYQWSVDTFSTFVGADTIETPSDPDTVQIGSLSANTLYQIRAISWDTSEAETDTSATLAITTEATTQRLFGGLK